MLFGIVEQKIGFRDQAVGFWVSSLGTSQNDLHGSFPK